LLWGRVRISGLLAIIAIVAELAACGGSAGTHSSPGPTTTTSASVPATGHVFLVVEENQSYSDVIGNAAMPYINSLAAKYSLATQYFADIHPSIGNYFMLTTGQIITNDDTLATNVDVDNLAHELTAAGKSWRSYAESLPQRGYAGGDTGLYVKRHNPFAYFTDVATDPSQAANLVPFSQFAADLANNTLPNFSFIVPNVNDDSHNGSQAASDDWLRNNIAPLLASPVFQQDGLLIIVYDESEILDVEHGGGHIAAILVGPKVKQGFQSTTVYQHESTLRLILQALGVNSFPGNSASAPSMPEFFN